MPKDNTTASLSFSHVKEKLFYKQMMKSLRFHSVQVLPRWKPYMTY